MSIFNSLRRAFGFDPDDDEIYLDDEPTSESGREDEYGEPDQDTLTPADPQPPAPEPAGITADTIAEEMMASVVELFNSFQPEFIARCLNPEMQKRLIAQHLSPSLLEQIEKLASAERSRIAREAAEERADIDADLRRMRERNDELEKRRMLFKDEQLSATRQKRALQERVHDLEAQAEQLEAEKEQLELENRSMSNKLRAVSVGGMNLSPDLAAGSDSEKIGNLNREIADLESQISSLGIQIKEADEQHDRDEETIRALTAELEDAKKRLKQAEADEAELNELRQQVEDLQEIASQTEKILARAEKQEARIGELKIRLKDAESAFDNVERLMKENKSLRSSLESNRYEYALEMSKLRTELEDMKRAKPKRGRPRKVWPKDDTQENQESPEKQPDKKPPHISAIDELLEGSEWLVAPTPEEVRIPMAEEPSDDFGYKAPPRKNTTFDDTNQLTLF